MSRSAHFLPALHIFDQVFGGNVQSLLLKDSTYNSAADCVPEIHGLPKVHEMAPSFSADGKLVAFTAWAWPGLSSRWGVLLYDTSAKKLIHLPKLNGETSDQRMP